MTSAPPVSVVILNWNGLPYVITCLEHVLASDYPNFSVIVIDNGSTDGSDGAIEEQFPCVTLRRTKTNLGYAVGNNIGIRESLSRRYDYILLLNNDTEIAPDMISQAVSALVENPNAGIAGARIHLLDDPDRLWAVGGVFKPCWIRTFGINEINSGQYDDIDVDYVFGCGMLIQSEVFRQVGLLDTRFFFYFEDIDLCLRAKKGGFEVIWVPQAKMRHKNRINAQSASSFNIYHYERSRFLFYCKHLHRVDKLCFLIAQAPHLVSSTWQYMREGHSLIAGWHVTHAMISALTICCNTPDDHSRR
jgi:GT2 family glycosyltransferase